MLMALLTGSLTDYRSAGEGRDRALEPVHVPSSHRESISLVETIDVVVGQKRFQS